MPILIKRPDGGVSIMNLAPGIEDVEGELTKWSSLNGPYESYEEVDETAIPPRDEYRNALGHSLTHRMDKAQDIHRDLLREARAPKLAALDIEFMKALETGSSSTAAIAAQKQALRDVTKDPRIAAAQTIADLKALGPEVLMP